MVVFMKYVERYEIKIDLTIQDSFHQPNKGRHTEQFYSLNIEQRGLNIV